MSAHFLKLWQLCSSWHGLIMVFILFSVLVGSWLHVIFSMFFPFAVLRILLCKNKATNKNIFLHSVYFFVSFTFVLHVRGQQKSTNWSIIKSTTALVYLRLKHHLVWVSQEELRRWADRCAMAQSKQTQMWDGRFRRAKFYFIHQITASSHHPIPRHLVAPKAPLKFH